MTDAAPPAVLVTRDGHVTVITINRPDARNAINLAVSLGIGDALAAADADPEVRAVIVTGAGDQAFSAGADLKALSRGEAIGPDDERRTRGFAGIVSHAIGKPLIAAVNGSALGGGTEIVLSCDLAIAAGTASFGLPEVKRGLFAAAGGVFRLPRQIPHKIAMAMILTGDPIDAAQALALGLVNAVVPAAELQAAAMALAQRIAANAPLSVQASKRIARGIVDGRIADEEAAWSANTAAVRTVMRSADAREGPLAFAQKRAPVWQAQ
ncbi:crotonase/enoyl-CoA hydratase family protein [Sphingomonas sp.]|uniref:crotonase/enoyl-CoA hydratase family protein n=1 Tax=Sphingomonas sp. TaxID=28214 RepID=UPI003CC5955E